jgi:hypothetical protein
MLARVLPEMHGALSADQFVISIAAGGRIAMIADGLAHPAIVRAMPNTPAQIGEGLTVWTATPAVTKAQREQTHMVFQALGKDVFVDDARRHVRGSNLPDGEEHAAHCVVESHVGHVSEIAAARRVSWQGGAAPTH